VTDPTKDSADDALCRWLDACPSPYHAVAHASERLRGLGAVAGHSDVGFRAIGGLLIAWRKGRQRGSARVIGAHTDSPNLRVKPHADLDAVGCHLIATEPYGGALLSSWFDRELGLSGRVMLRDDPVPQLVRHDDLGLVLPRLAIHLDRTVNDSGHAVDPQRHLGALWGVGGSGASSAQPSLRSTLAAGLGVAPDRIDSWDLMTHDLVPAAIGGWNGSLLTSGRLDNLVSCWLALDALESVIEDEPERTVVIAWFDHEEVGSESATGAVGPELGRALAELAVEPRDSLLLSADMAHGLHPHFPERHEPGHPVLLGGGPALKINVKQRYATDAVTAAEMRRIARSADVSMQTYVHRADMACGSTIGPIASARLGLPTADVGLPMLAMHSCRETMATSDVVTGRKLFRAFVAD